jgi:hypothetical protein
MAWKFEDGERFLGQALSRVQESLRKPAQPPGISRYFDARAMAVA